MNDNPKMIDQQLILIQNTNVNLINYIGMDDMIRIGPSPKVLVGNRHSNTREIFLDYLHKINIKPFILYIYD